MSPTAQIAHPCRAPTGAPRRHVAAPVAVLGAIAVVSIAAAAAGPTAVDGPLPGYRLSTVWPASSHGLPAPLNISGGPGGRLWVMDAGAGKAVALDATGIEVASAPIPPDGLDMAVGPTGDVFLGRWSARPLLRAVSRYGGTGAEAWTRECLCGTGSGITIAGGRVWLTEPAAGTLEWMNTADGQVSGLLKPPGAAAGFPADVDAAPDRTLVATDLIAGAVYAWPPPYLPADVIRWQTVELSGPFRVAGGADDDGDVLVSVLFSDGLVRVYRLGGLPVARFRVPGEPADIAMGTGAQIFVLDQDTGAIRVYVPGPPPTATPSPVDPPLTGRSCLVTGSRTLIPPRVSQCGAVEVAVRLTAACPPGAVVGADVVLLIDRSGSMIKGRQMESARDAAQRLLDGLDFGRHQAAVVTFNQAATVAQPLTTDLAALRAALSGILPGGDTNIAAAIRAAATLLAADGRPNALPVLVLLSDGAPSRPMVPEANVAALVAAERARSRRAHIFTIGLGRFVDSLLLEAIATSPADFFYAPGPADLAAIYDRIGAEIQALSLTDLIITDALDPSFVAYLPGSGRPAPLRVGDSLVWTRPALPSAGLTISYTLQARRPGRQRVGNLRVRYLDADGTRRTFRPSEPLLDVEAVLGTPLPGATPRPGPSPTPGATPSPGPTATSPTPEPAPLCEGSRRWSVAIDVFRDAVGAGGYDCPGCNGTWDGGDAAQPLTGAAVVAVKDSVERTLWQGPVAVGPSGRASAVVSVCSPPPYRVVLLQAPPGTVSCPNSPRDRWADGPTLAGQYTARFALWGGCGLPTAPPPATPVPPVPVTCPDPGAKP